MNISMIFTDHVFTNEAFDNQNGFNQEQYERLDFFVRKSMQDFDESHDYNHAKKVLENSLLIAISNEYRNAKLNLTTLVYSAFCHDIRDHKYSNSISFDEFYRFLKQEVPDNADDIVTIIDNISYSKQNKKRIETGSMKENDIPENLKPYIDIVRDADRLEAIGKTGLKRCEDYQLSHGNKVPEDVIKHCHEKLLKLLPENFIVSEKAKELAIPLHDELLEYIKFHSHK